MWTPEGIKALASLVTAVSWPLLALVSMMRFAPQVGDMLSRLSDVEVFGLKAKVAQKLAESASEAEATDAKDLGPTQADVVRAAEVAKMAAKAPPTFVKQQAEDLAAEYEQVRASMLPGDKRTRAMSVVVSKMRAIGGAVFPQRYILAASPSPGRRLMAMVSLQLTPDYEMLAWLAGQISKETPFVGYHALVALNRAAEGPEARGHMLQLQDALRIANDAEAGFMGDPGRIQLLGALNRRVTALGSDAAADAALAD